MSNLRIPGWVGQRFHAPQTALEIGREDTTRTDDGERLPALTALQRDYNGVLSADTRKSVSLSAFARTVRSDKPRLFAAASTSSH